MPLGAPAAIDDNDVMNRQDEPILGGGSPGSDDTDEPRVRSRIEGLLRREPYAVLCTQGDGQPYGSVVAFAAENDLRTLVFATGRETRKFRLMTESPRVAVVVDSRDRHPDELMAVEAVTVTGRAREVPEGAEFDRLSARLLERHPGLRSFLDSPTTALIRVDVVRYLHVRRFQEVHQWRPSPA
jgi:nitroimidazol reductase NimA-like FMN-containing flavoprotein (pyridoxamine 5'-phosphate oxidase superfamily)